MRFFATGIAALLAFILTLPLLLLAAPFLLMSRVVHWFARVTEPAVGDPTSLVRFDPVLGWRPSSNLDTHYLVKGADVYPLVTDSDGWPGKLTLDESQIVIVGDSYAYGYGAHKGESFADLLAEIKVKALASPGYDMVQETILLQTYAAKLKGKLVLWWIYLENDLPDNMRPDSDGYRKPFITESRETTQWEIVTSHIRREKWHHTIRSNNMETFSHLCAPTPIAERHYAACEHLIAQSAVTCREHGIQLVIMTIPNVNQLSANGHQRLLSYGVDKGAFDPRYPDIRIGQICATHGIPFFPLFGRLRDSDYNIYERFHWNRPGHAKAAEVVREVWHAYRNGSLTPDPSNPDVATVSDTRH
jgi:hypothetical protein